MPLKYRYYKENLEKLFLKLTDGDQEDADDIRFFLENKANRLWVFDGWDMFTDFMERAIETGGDISIFHTADDGGYWHVVEYMNRKELIEFLHDAVDGGELRFEGGNKSLVRIPIKDLPEKRSSVKVIQVPKFPSVNGFTDDPVIADGVIDELYDGVKCHTSTSGIYLIWYILDNDETTFYYCRSGGDYEISTMSPSEMAKFIGDTVESLENEK